MDVEQVSEQSEKGREAKEGEDGSQDQENHASLDMGLSGESAGQQKEQQKSGGSKQEQDRKGASADRKDRESEGGDQARKQTAGTGDQEASFNPSLSEGKALDTAEQFDQLGQQGSEEDQQAAKGGAPAQQGKKGSSLFTPIMEQWLSQVEGDPAYLLRNQFSMEERRAQQKYGRELMDTRPW